MAITAEADPRPDEYIQLIHSPDGAYAAYDVTAPIRDTSLADPLRTTSPGKPDANRGGSRFESLAANPF